MTLASIIRCSLHHTPTNWSFAMGTMGVRLTRFGFVRGRTSSGFTANIVWSFGPFPQQSTLGPSERGDERWFIPLRLFIGNPQAIYVAALRDIRWRFPIDEARVNDFDVVSNMHVDNLIRRPRG
ncbi:uncharacterized protein STEHIDRAFT_143531 [Stereum hirsutum FP-91666 SS1]|uniref:uncharacterized protein n=1 Tax=Stereum hirsutum (strain FP-91666) TaxID=721885 RepID=UPI000440EC92|nr:uncharacterized protein STEHIDRAFT_143531 [Stereum hirsutum FP-91666 SS1]EIM92079.1 hypothetical protein STEHIDRAFT_143531 [Stereum hirsutum FP-91666 SS1]